MDENKLKLLGLNTYEIKVLITLLYKGKSKASFICANSGVPNGKIYDVLASLEEKGLIATIPENVKYFVAKPISHLKNLLKEKQQELNELDKDLEKLKNITEEHIKGEILVVKGKKGFHNLMKNIQPTNKICYNLKWKANITDMNFQKTTKEMLKKNVNIKTLYDINTPKENIEYWNKKFPQLAKNTKYIKVDGIAMNILDKQVFFSIVELNSTLLITSEKFANMMKQLFEGYWESKKEIT